MADILGLFICLIIACAITYYVNSKLDEDEVNEYEYDDYEEE